MVNSKFFIMTIIAWTNIGNIKINRIITSKSNTCINKYNFRMLLVFIIGNVRLDHKFQFQHLFHVHHKQYSQKHLRKDHLSLKEYKNFTTKPWFTLQIPILGYGNYHWNCYFCEADHAVFQHGCTKMTFKHDKLRRWIWWLHMSVFFMKKKPVRQKWRCTDNT